MSRSALGDRRLVRRAGLALVVANIRYWTTVAPVVRKELRRWEQRAGAIDDPELRALALSKLHDEGFHAEASAMLATLAPHAHRRDAVEAIVALELLFDYLDGLTERPTPNPLRDGERLFGALISAVAVPPAVPAKPPAVPAKPPAVPAKPPAVPGDLLQKPSRCADGYLQELSRAVVLALARLPAAAAITEVAQRTAARSGQAQTRMHAAPQLGTAQLEQWGKAEAEGTGLGWRELLAGAASSVLVLHALIASAADAHTTSAQAEAIASAYLSTCVLLTLLDGLVDHEQDQGHDGPDEPGYLSLYEDRQELSEVLAQGAQRAATQARALPHGAHHAMTLVGVVAYYTSAPGAKSDFAKPLAARLQDQLAPLIAPTLALMRIWRLAKGMRSA